MNTFGHYFRLSIFGESHGYCAGITIDGCPAGLPLAPEDFLSDLNRRKGAGQKAVTPRKEEDYPRFLSGIFEGKTTGFPLTLIFENQNIKSDDYAAFRAIPRPGHADMTARQKFGGFEDYRGGGHFSARLTAGIVAAGVVAKKILKNIKIHAKLIEVGGENDIEKGIHKALQARDSVGGIIECCAENMPTGLGEPYFHSLESQLAALLFSIPAVKGLEFGAGFRAARMFGSEHNDAILTPEGKTKSNHAGGINGGISNGNPLIFRIALKPTPSTPQKQTSINLTTGEQASFVVKGRHDLCVALRAPVIVEAVTAVVLADCMIAEQKIPRVCLD
jgi:chorismate synthase